MKKHQRPEKNEFFQWVCLSILSFILSVFSSPRYLRHQWWWRQSLDHFKTWLPSRKSTAGNSEALACGWSRCPNIFSLCNLYNSICFSSFIHSFLNAEGACMETGSLYFKRASAPAVYSFCHSWWQTEDRILLSWWNMHIHKKPQWKWQIKKYMKK